MADKVQSVWLIEHRDGRVLQHVYFEKDAVRRANGAAIEANYLAGDTVYKAVEFTRRTES